MESHKHRILVKDIFQAAIQAVDPYIAVSLQKDNLWTVCRDSNFRRFLIAGFGKAACPMAKAVEDSLGDIIDAGIVITKYGHAGGSGSKGPGRKIKIFEAGHPLPDENGVRATEDLTGLLKSAGEHTLVVCLISGGGSALLVSPYEGVTLAEKQEITNLLLRAGADIYELNTVRKHISKVKGGRLAEIAYPAKIISLVLSDVMGDRLDVIASGPTSPDTTTYHDALKVMKKYGLMDRSPKSIVETLYKGSRGLIPDTPKEGDKIFERVENIIIGSSRTALAAAKKKAEELGFHAEIISSELAGEAGDAGKWIAEKAREVKNRRGKRPFAPARCLISGGETTVTVKGSGLGGRNMELALSLAIELEGVKGITLLSAGTDGTDGPTDAAGAIVDGETIKKARHAGLDPLQYLADNDSYNFFRKIDGLFITGPTGTNVMDLQIVVLD